MTAQSEKGAQGDSAAPCCGMLAELLSPELFKALADPSRIAVLCSVAAQSEPVTVSEVATCCPTDLSVVSRHLSVLKRAGVVEAQKKGREVFYSLRHLDLANRLRQLADAIEGCCPAATTSEK